MCSLGSALKAREIKSSRVWDQIGSEGTDGQPA